MVRVVFPVGFVLFIAFDVRAGDWPEFRGPTGQGIVVEDRIPFEWGPEKNVVWKQSLPGKAWSSPSVVDGKIYLTNAVPEGQGGSHSLRALCLAAKTGKVIWDKEVFKQDGKTAPPVHTKNSHASPTPLVYGGKIFVHFGHMGTACLDLDGKVLWKNETLTYRPVHGNGGTPILVDDLLVFSCDGAENPFVVALEKDTGKVRWKSPRDIDAFKKFSFSTPLLIEVKGKKQIITPGSHVVSALDPKDGKEIWKVTYEGYSVIPRPVYGHGLVFICTGYDEPTVIAIKVDGEGDVTNTNVAWTLKQGAPHAPSPLLDGEELYVVSDRGIATCLDAKTGKVHWRERLGGNYSASPILADGKVYFQSEEGVGTVVKAGRKFEKVATSDLKERTLASFAVADGALFIRTASQLYRFQAK